MNSLAGKRLVVFGCGYVGAAVARWGDAAGLKVTALTRNPATALLLREVGLSTVVADLAGSAWHDDIPGEPEFAVDCVSSGGGGVEAYRRSYVGGMESILGWARAKGRIGTLVYTGSTSVYPQGDGARVDETMPATARNERAQLLLDTEARLAAAGEAVGRRFILRLAGIYGPGRHHLLEQVKAGAISGFGQHHLNLIHRDDIVDAIAACLAAPATVANEVINLADDGAATKAEIVRWLASTLGVVEPTFTGEPAEGRGMGTPDRVIVNRKAKALLGWKPRYPTFREGYAKLLSR
jgi:nucleoside-diphosphate-sugar epimerase